MKKQFVLDENILISTATLKNERGEDDYASLTLFGSIVVNCHKILLTEEILQKYYDKFKTLDKDEYVVVNIASAFASLMTNDEKIIWDVNLEHSYPEKAFDGDDISYVNLSAKRHAILVTQDNKLIEDLLKASITATYKFEVKRPEAAIQDACASS